VNVKGNMVYTHILFGHKEEWNSVIWRKIDETRVYHVKQNKPDTERQVQYCKCFSSSSSSFFETKQQKKDDLKAEGLSKKGKEENQELEVEKTEGKMDIIKAGYRHVCKCHKETH
jgi:hypothetical protein